MNRFSSIKTAWSRNRGFMLFLGLMFVFRSAVADWNYVPSSSMNPTLWRGDRVMINKLAYSLRVPFTLVELARWGQPERGDVITFDSPADDVNLIKRVVALGGDRVRMSDNQLYLNDQPVPRQMVQASRAVPSEAGDLPLQVWHERLGERSFEVAQLPALNRWRDFPEVAVPAGTVMVLGDSRDNSRDSRFIGFIDLQRITGRATRVVLSHDPEQAYLPRANRWWLPLDERG